MNSNQSLILAMYAGFGVLVLLAGFVYKELRNRRERRKNPTFNFPSQKQDVTKNASDRHLTATR
jgi:hypothetical protein